MKLSNAWYEIRRAISRLEKSDTRIKRRNARRVLWGLMKRIKNAVNEEYPAIAKPKPPPVLNAPPKPAEPPKLPPVKMPFRRVWGMATAELFARLVLSHYDRYPASGEIDWFMGGKWDVLAWKLAKVTIGSGPDAMLSPKHLDYYLFHARALEIVELYRKFWMGEIFVADLELAAEHQKFIERRRK